MRLGGSPLPCVIILLHILCFSQVLPTPICAVLLPHLRVRMEGHKGLPVDHGGLGVGGEKNEEEEGKNSMENQS